MTRSHLRRVVQFVTLMALPFSLLSCSAGSLIAERESMPAARASLMPEYRIFYDSLSEYGDWVLIEPFGYVFRPRVNPVAWRPFEDGFWTPTDVYGWTWISSEPFGWATYHYGTWLSDRFQGWVWVPGTEWGPAWVNWETTDEYVGWAPQSPRGGSYSNLPTSAFSYVPVSAMGSPALSTKILDPATAAAKVQNPRRIDNTADVQGVRINRGPDIRWVEEHTGPLQRTRVQDLVPPGDAATLRQREAARRPQLGGAQRGDGLATPGASGALRHVTSPDSTRDAAAQAAREARAMQDRGFVGPRIQVVRPIGVPERRAPGLQAPGRSARDTTRGR